MVSTSALDHVLTSPRGITAARPPFFILRFEARPLGLIDMSDLKRLRCLLEPCFEFFNFPKTAAGPGASEKPCGRLGRRLGALGRALNTLDRLLGSLEAVLSALGGLLGRSWGLPGASWTLLGRLGGDPKQDKNEEHF